MTGQHHNKVAILNADELKVWVIWSSGQRHVVRLPKDPWSPVFRDDAG